MKPHGSIAFLVCLLCASCLDSGQVSQAEDWPTYRHDQRRSGQTSEKLATKQLAAKWTWQSQVPPKSAWPDSARWDAYAKLDGLKSMREYDLAFQPIIVGNHLLFASNVDDSVRCFAMESGELTWQFTAGGPIRVAPVVHQSAVYFGSDDGSIYSLDKNTGALRWRHEAVPGAARFVNDGRLCSFQPIRSGILIDEERQCLIAASGIFPWHDSHFVCLSLEQGELQWEKDLGTGWTLEGPMLTSSNRIISPQGRAPPQVFDLANGKSLGALPGGGGSIAVVDELDNVFHGPGNKAGWITGSKLESREKLATIENGRSIVIQRAKMFVLESSAIYALDRESGRTLWRNSLDGGLEVILADETLFVAAGHHVLALDSNSGELLWGSPVSGKIYGLAVANGCLVASTDKGEITVFSEAGKSQASPDVNLLAARTGFAAQETNEDQLASGPANTPAISSDPSLLERWLFHSNQAKASDASESQSLASLAAEGLPLPLTKDARFKAIENEHAWELDEGQDATARSDFRSGKFPMKAMSAVATVRLDRGQPWGGLLSMSQDNGAYEKGWILGFRNKRLGFALNGEGGPDQLTWLTDKKDFTEGSWHHVVATYDGQLAKLFVDGEQVAESDKQSGNIAYPEKCIFQVGSYKDDDEHFYTAGRLNEVALYDRALTRGEIAELFTERQDKLAGRLGHTEQAPESGLPQPYTTQNLENLFTNFRGPRFRFDTPGVATVFWTSPESTRLKIVGGQASAKPVGQEELEETTGTGEPEQVWTITGIQPREIIHFVIEGPGGKVSKVYECDGHFDFALYSLGKENAQSTANSFEVERAIQTLFGETRSRGLALVHGSDKGQVELARSLSLASDMHIVLIAKSEDETRIRDWLQQKELYGRIVVESESKFASLPNGVFNLIVAHGETEQEKNEDGQISKDYSRILKPGGWLLVPESASIDVLSSRFETAEAKQVRLLSSKGFNAYPAQRAEDSAGWTHMYGLPDNSAFAGESLAGASRITDLRLTWAGRPGPRYQSDRGNRKPSPLASGGRLFLQGLKRLIALDAHNGTILWAWEMPEMVRFNVPRDCSNWCADEDHVFVAIQDECNVLDAKSGEIAARHRIVQPAKTPAGEPDDWNWGFVARHYELLLGSCVRAGNTYEGFWGGEFWYDAKDGDLAKKVCSDSLFALDAETGLPIWNFESGLIVNPTISISDKRIVFLECRSKTLKSAEARMLDGEEFWNNMWLVAIDTASGQKLWELPAKPMPGTSAVYGVCANDTFLLQTSQAGDFAVYAFSLATGKMLWRGKYKWEADHHGKHLSRPAVVNNKIYLRPLTLDLNDGKVLSSKFPAGHQCGTYTASSNALFLRAGNLTMWDGESQAATRWDRVRPDCWISTIPAEGMLLSPEGGGGCSCGGWLETSIGFAPIRN